MSEPVETKQVDKPFWKSTKVFVYAITLATLIVFVYTGVDQEVVRTIAESILFGLPILLSGQGALDWAAMRKSK